jgi:hypothetical protein
VIALTICACRLRSAASAITPLRGEGGSACDSVCTPTLTRSLRAISNSCYVIISKAHTITSRHARARTHPSLAVSCVLELDEQAPRVGTVRASIHMLHHTADNARAHVSITSAGIANVMPLRLAVCVGANLRSANALSASTSAGACRATRSRAHCACAHLERQRSQCDEMYCRSVHHTHRRQSHC